MRARFGTVLVALAALAATRQVKISAGCFSPLLQSLQLGRLQGLRTSKTNRLRLAG